MQSEFKRAVGEMTHYYFLPIFEVAKSFTKRDAVYSSLLHCDNRRVHIVF